MTNANKQRPHLGALLKTSRGRVKYISSAGNGYRILGVSMYEEDVVALDELVHKARKAGHTKATRSSLLRYAFRLVDVSTLPKGL